MRLRRKGLTIDDMLAMQRVADPEVSPDGKQVAFTCATPTIDANKGRIDLWLAAIDGSARSRRLTTHPEQRHRSAVVARRQVDLLRVDALGGSAQVWRIAVDRRRGRAGDEAADRHQRLRAVPRRQAARRRDRRLPRREDARRHGRSATSERAKSKVKAQAYDQLLFRHWDQWEDGKYSHLFVWKSGDARRRRDLTPGHGHRHADAPVRRHGGGRRLARRQAASRTSRASAAARSRGRPTPTCSSSPPTGGKPVDLTADNKAYDFEPAFSPDGKSLALTQMKRAGLRGRSPAHRDHRRRDPKKLRVVTEAWDRSPGEPHVERRRQDDLHDGRQPRQPLAVRDRRRDRQREACSSTRAPTTRRASRASASCSRRTR